MFSQRTRAYLSFERAMTPLLNLQSGEDNDSKAHIVALHCSQAYRAVQQPLSRSCARHLRLRQECAFSFIVLPLPHDERR
jgi:hypothetical protein